MSVAESSSMTKIRRATESDVPELRRLVNSAYRELADMGLNYTGSYQDEDVTRDRMREAEVYVMEDQVTGRLLASINFYIKPTDDGVMCIYLGQLAVRPDMKGRGIASRLLALAEEKAMFLDIRKLQLDTATSAQHLVGMYQRRGYQIASEVQWAGKTYKSYIMEKSLNGIRIVG